jgi:hypothetical protein
MQSQEVHTPQDGGESAETSLGSASKTKTKAKSKTRLVWIAAASVAFVGLSALGLGAFHSTQMDSLYESCVAIKAPVAGFNTNAGAKLVLGDWEIDEEGELKDSSSEFVYDGNRLEMFSAAQLEDFQFSILPETGRFKTSLETITAVWPSVRDSIGDLKNTPDGQKYRQLESEYKKAALDHIVIVTQLIQITTDAVIRGEEVVLPKGLERRGDLLVERQEELESKMTKLAEQVSAGAAYANFKDKMGKLLFATKEIRDVCASKNFGNRPSQG